MVGFSIVLVGFLLWQHAAAGQSITQPAGVGAALGLYKPDVQMPIPEKVEPTITMQPTVTYKPSLELHTKGFCVPRQAWQLTGAYAVDCPADTYMQNYYSGKQVCAATRCSGPFGANKPSMSLPQMKNTLLGQFASDAVANSPATYRGGDAGTICKTVLIKPIMTCGDGCVSDKRLYGDWCLCPNGNMPCPYNSQGTGYQWCQCDQLGPPYGLCVADAYYCAYYCQYAPSWVFTAVAKGAMLCPVDPATIDPYNADPIMPGWDTTTNYGRR